jgi:hypothetical protein
VAKKKLPILKTAASEGHEEAEPRPPWHWVGFGTVAIMAAWLPLAGLSQSVLTRTIFPSQGAPPSGNAIVAFVLTQAFALALASGLGGALVGRYGGEAGPRESAMAGFCAGLIPVVLSLSSGFSPIYFGVIALAVCAAWLGGKLGLKKRTT